MSQPAWIELQGAVEAPLLVLVFPGEVEAGLGSDVTLGDIAGLVGVALKVDVNTTERSEYRPCSKAEIPVIL
jgi:hypothetical protein